MPITVIRNARLWTGNPANPQVSCLAAVDGKIAALGSETDILPYLASADQVIDAGRAFGCPGFIDTHVHLTISGMGLLALDLSKAENITTVIDSIRDYSFEEHKLIVALNFQPEKLWEKRFPSPAEMDQAAGGKPVYVMDRSGHWSAVNQAALDLLNLAPDTPGIGRDHNGDFDGVLADRANSAAFTQLWPLFLEEVGVERAFELATRNAAAGGVTTIHALDDLEHVQQMLKLQERLPVRLRAYTQSRDVAAVSALGLRQIGGCGPVMVDGDFDPHTAALLEPYADQPDTHGTLYYSDEELNEYVQSAHQAGLQIALHCVGSAAIEQLLNAYEQALTLHPRPNHRHRIEHFELPAPGQAERARRLGVALAVQPSFNYFWPHDHAYPEVVGSERAAQVDPLRSLVEIGLPVALGSDSPVTPMRGLLWMHSAINHSNPAERIPVETALRMATSAGAYLGFEEQIKGTLEIGKLADLVLLSADPREVQPADIQSIQVLKTIVGGKVVYDGEKEQV